MLLPLPLGEVSPQVTERAYAVTLSTKVLSAMRKLSGVLLALPLGELANPQGLTERAHAVNLGTKVLIKRYEKAIGRTGERMRA